MKRVLGTILVGLALSPALAACSNHSEPLRPIPPRSTTTVVSKEIEPGEWETKKVRTCKGYKAGKPKTNANCSRWGTDVKKEWDDEDYVLHLSDGHEVDVTKIIYDYNHEGQPFHG